MLYLIQQVYEVSALSYAQVYTLSKIVKNQYLRVLAGRCQIRNIMTLHVIATERSKDEGKEGAWQG